VRRKSQAVHHAEIYSAIFAHKAVLALYFEHFRHPLPITGGVSAFWKTKEDFAPEGIPSARRPDVEAEIATLGLVLVRPTHCDRPRPARAYPFGGGNSWSITGANGDGEDRMRNHPT
jgi:hypothetical protein